MATFSGLRIGTSSNSITTICQDTINSTFTFNNSGTTSNAATLKTLRVGDVVYISIIGNPLATTGTASTAFTSNTALPVGFRPSATVYSNNCLIGVNATSPGTAAYATLTSAGILAFSLLSGAYANSLANSGVQVTQTLTFYVG
jgi:hypothetical protein